MTVWVEPVGAGRSGDPLTPAVSAGAAPRFQATPPAPRSGPRGSRRRVRVSSGLKAQLAGLITPPRHAPPLAPGQRGAPRAAPRAQPPSARQRRRRSPREVKSGGAERPGGGPSPRETKHRLPAPHARHRQPEDGGNRARAPPAALPGARSAHLARRPRKRRSPALCAAGQSRAARARIPPPGPRRSRRWPASASARRRQSRPRCPSRDASRLTSDLAAHPPRPPPQSPPRPRPAPAERAALRPPGGSA